jgi:hypothetical protein
MRAVVVDQDAALPRSSQETIGQAKKVETIAV